MSDPFKYPHENNSVAYWKTRHKLLTGKYERLVTVNEELREALKITTAMYERATGLPMPSQAARILVVAEAQ